MRYRGLVFVVDDDAAVRGSLALYLRRFGWRVVTASNGRIALDRLRSEEKPAAILSDVSMPEMNGTRLHDAVARIPKLRKVPFIQMSACSQKEASPGTTFLAKPFEPRELCRLLDSITNTAKEDRVA